MKKEWGNWKKLQSLWLHDSLFPVDADKLKIDNTKSVYLHGVFSRWVAVIKVTARE